MLLTEFNEEAYKNDWFEQGMEKGMAKGMEKGILSTLYGLVRDRLLTPEQGAQRANVSLESFNEGYLQFCS